MKKLILAIVLIIIALIVGFVVGRSTASIDYPVSTKISEQVETSTPVVTEPESATTSTEATDAPPVNTSQLTQEQREMLSSFGIDADALVVTASMITCAETKIGKARIEEIFNGATPTFFEGLDLFSCYKQ